MKKWVLYIELTLLLAIFTSFASLFIHMDVNNSIDTDAAQQKSYPTIILDAGHGGNDGGTSSKSGILEKDLNLKYAFYIRDYLVLRGYDVVLTRDGDYMLLGGEGTSKKRQDLQNRLKFSENYENAIFISIHMNSYPSPDCKGLQVYYSENSPEGQYLAAYIQSFTHNFLQPENMRNIKPATSSIYILDNIKIPAVLIECGFLSNYEEAAALCDINYTKKMAITISSAIEEYLNSQNNL